MRMHFLCPFLLLLVAARSATPDGPRIEGSKRLGQAVDCTGTVVFSALTTKPPPTDANKVIPFDTSLIDKSVGYSRDRGIFTTHCPGLYQFTFTATGNPSSRFSLRKRPSASTASWNTIALTDSAGGSHTLFLDMEVGEQAAIFLDSGALSPSASHSFSGHRVAKK